MSNAIFSTIKGQLPTHVSNAIDFNKDLHKFVAGLDIEHAKFIKLVAYKVFNGVVQRTPVDTGIARASWVVGVGKKHPYHIAIPGATATFPNFDYRFFKGRVNKVVISNYVPYIFMLENGSSKQAPYGMAAITVREVTEELKLLTSG